MPSIYDIGYAIGLLGRSREKQAADTPATTYALKGKLQLSKSGWIILSVPNALARGLFDTLGEPGVELPPGEPFNAHISVIRPEELDGMGGADKIIERGHDFSYTTGAVKTVAPAGWNEMSKVWFLEVKSPDLENLRKSYGLTALPKNNQFQFHITFAVRRKNILKENDLAVGRSVQSVIHNPGIFADEFKRQQAQKAAAVLDDLKLAKSHSDKRDYPSKHAILHRLLADHPNDFHVDAPGKKYHGLTHGPTGFRIHAPAWLVPAGLKKAAGVEVESSSSVLGDDEQMWCARCHEKWEDCECPGKEETEKVARFITRAELLAIGREAVAPKSPAQADAGNYRKGHLYTHGFNITIENGKGSTRSGVSKDGTTWSNKMVHHYGYIRGTVGKDKDHLDVFIGDDPHSELVFVINQADTDTGALDEHKCCIGFANEAAARAGYLAHYPAGWKGLDSIHALTLPQFKAWLSDGDMQKPYKPAEKTASQEKTADVRPPPNWWALSQILDRCGLSEKKAALLPGVQLQPHQQALADESHDEVRKLLYHTLGSGKTLTSLGAAEASGDPYTAVTPAALRPNFRKEQAKWTDLQTPSSVTSYNAIAKGDTPAADTLIFDEAHRLRNPASAQTQAAFHLADKAKRVYLLSGSPIVNHPHDLAPLMQMATGNPITPEEFDNKFVGERTISPGLWDWLGGAESVKEPAMINQDEFRDAWDGHVSYHAPLKAGVQQDEEHYNVPMSTDQHRLYNAFWDQLPFLLRWKLQGSYPLSHSELLKLNSFLSGPRQVSLSTLPFMRGNADALAAFNGSPKLQKAVGFMQEAHEKDPNFRGVAYSNFVNAGLMPYAAALTAAGIPHSIFHGGMNDAQKKAAVDAYNTGKSRVLLLGPAGSEGISLKGTRMLQILDPHWNTARTSQAIGRGVRFDSHTDLPEDQRQVRVQHFNSELPPGLWQRMWEWIHGKPEDKGESAPNTNPGVDTYLQRMAKRKDHLNQEFLQELQSIGAPKAAAYTYVPTPALGTVMSEGLYSGKALLGRPDLLALAAKGRNQQPADFTKSINDVLTDWKPHSAEGPNIMFRSAPQDMTLPENHPSKTMDLTRVKVRLQKLLRDYPATRVHGQELRPYSDEEDKQYGDAYADMRHHDLTADELKRYSRASAKRLWQHFEDIGNVGRYAPNVPHAAVITPTGIIPSKYLKVGSAK